MNVHVYPGVEEAARACAELIASRLESALERRVSVSLAVSGGSTPEPMFRALASESLDWGRVHLFWADERCVPPGDEQSNYRAALDALIRPSGIPERNVHRVCGELPPEEAARNYALEVGRCFGLAAGAIPEFDVIHLGIGPDGHTASLFPGNPLVYERHGLAAAVNAPKKPNSRITLLPAVLLRAKQIAVLAGGADKADAIQRIFEECGDVLQFPARLLRESSDRVDWFLDRDAAAKIAGHV